MSTSLKTMCGSYPDTHPYGHPDTAPKWYMTHLYLPIWKSWREICIPFQAQSYIHPVVSADPQSGAGTEIPHLQFLGRPAGTVEAALAQDGEARLLVPALPLRWYLTLDKLLNLSEL